VHVLSVSNDVDLNHTRSAGPWPWWKWWTWWCA